MGGYVTHNEAWCKSSYSADGASCVEVAWNSPGSIAIRDSKDPDGLRLVFALTVWKKFARQIRNDEF